MPQQVNPDQQTAQNTPESGLRFDRAWFVREEEYAVTPDDPEWMLYSERLIETDGDPDPALERLDGLGTPDPVSFGKGVEENEATITYSLQQPLVDENGEPVDACYDAFTRNLANQIPNSHSMIGRDNNLSPGPDDPEGTSGQRRYLVMKGGKSDVTLEPDATEPDPIPVELTYQAARLRSYHIYQPETASTVAAVSTSAEDVDITVTVESEGASESEELSLDGDTAVLGEVQFEDIDAVELSEPATGDVEIRLEDGEGSVLTSIDGGESYADGDGERRGDLGVPTLGEGSTPDPIDHSFEEFCGSIFDFDFAGDAPTPDLHDISVEVDNDLDPRPASGDTPGCTTVVEEGNRELTIDTNVVGERASHDMLRSAYLNRSSDIGWELTQTIFTFPDSQCTEPPAFERGSDDTYAETEGTWESKGVQIESNL